LELGGTRKVNLTISQWSWSSLDDWLSDFNFLFLLGLFGVISGTSLGILLLFGESSL